MRCEMCEKAIGTKATVCRHCNHPVGGGTSGGGSRSSGTEDGDEQDDETQYIRLIARKNETIRDVAEREGVSAADLLSWNVDVYPGISLSARLRTGTHLMTTITAMPTTITATPTTTTTTAMKRAAQLPPVMSPAPRPRVQKPKVVTAPVDDGTSWLRLVTGRNETVTDVAKRHGLSPADLLSWNVSVYKGISLNAKLETGTQLMTMLKAPEEVDNSGEPADSSSEVESGSRATIDGANISTETAASAVEKSLLLSVNWVQCADAHCEKWHELPSGTEAWSGRFRCKMNTWAVPEGQLENKCRVDEAAQKIDPEHDCRVDQSARSAADAQVFGLRGSFCSSLA